MHPREEPTLATEFAQAAFDLGRQIDDLVRLRTRLEAASDGGPTRGTTIGQAATGLRDKLDALLNPDGDLLSGH
jgi:hypothetical protein